MEHRAGDGAGRAGGGAHLPQHGGVRGSLLEAGHHGQRPVQMSRLHPAPEDEVRVRLQPGGEVSGGQVGPGEGQPGGESERGRAG